MSGDAAPLRLRAILERLYRVCLRVYPLAFRDRFGREISEAFRDSCRQRRGFGLLLHGAHAVAEVVLEGARRRLADPRGSAVQRAAGVTQACDLRSRGRGGGRDVIRSILSDARLALRGFTRSPTFAATVVAVLALGIGANTAIFSVVSGILLRPLPYPDSERLVEIREVMPNGSAFSVSPPNFFDFRGSATLLDAVVATDIADSSFTLAGEGDPERVPGMRVSPGFFELLGARPRHGRTFLPDEDMSGYDPVVILSHGFWQRRFGGDVDVLGRTVTLDAVPRTIIGIAPRGFGFGSSAVDLWVPFEFSRRDLDGRGRHYLRVLARLEPGVEIHTAVQELQAIGVRLAEAYPETNAEWSVTAAPLLQRTVQGVRAPLLALMGAALLVLLIACANVANLILARMEGRGRELALRAALGAGRGRLLQLVLAESLLLALMGGALGLGLAYAVVHLMVPGVGSEMPRIDEIHIDSVVIAFVMLLTPVVGILVGSIPAWHGCRRDLLPALQEGGSQLLGGVRKSRIRGILVVSEVALSLMLVTGAGLLLQSFWRLTHVDIGFNHARLLTGHISLPESRYETDLQRSVFFSDLVDKIERLPGVESAAAITGIPFVGGRNTEVTVPERPDEVFDVERRRVTPGYFRTLEIPLLEGRVATKDDTPGSSHVVVVNEAFARRAFPGESAVGERVAWGGPWGPEDLEIIGVVGNVKQYGLDEGFFPTVYLDHAQIYSSETMSLVVRAARDPLDLAAPVRGVVRSMDPDLPFFGAATMEQRVLASVVSRRRSTFLASVFAVVALVLAAVGIYGVMSYTVSQRTREIGVRVALGAGHGQVLGLVMAHGMKLALLGVSLGIAGALGLGRVLAGLLFGVGARDPWTLVAVAGLVAMIAALACYLPARRATRMDPVDALRLD